jgi:hypothetical protein
LVLAGIWWQAGICIWAGLAIEKPREKVTMDTANFAEGRGMEFSVDDSRTPPGEPEQGCGFACESVYRRVREWLESQRIQQDSAAITMIARGKDGKPCVTVCILMAERFVEIFNSDS